MFFKISLKAALITLSQENRLNLSDMVYMNVFVDEHTTATDGLYKLKEGLISIPKSTAARDNRRRLQRTT